MFTTACPTPWRWPSAGRAQQVFDAIRDEFLNGVLYGRAAVAGW
ncbi:MAG: hypothetical protein AAGF92_01995 [Myxococcota bacterium]